MLHIPPNPLDRFCDVYTALLADRPWWQGKTMLRYCALPLCTLPGEPREIASRLDALAEELKNSTPWYKRSSVGVMLAAQLMRHGGSVAEFTAEVTRAGELFRAHWRIFGSTYEALAIEVLRQETSDRRVSAQQVARLAAIWTEMKQDHPILTQKSDWPACALLAGTNATPQQIRARLEALYQAIHARGFTRSDALQGATTLLFFHREEPGVLSARFQDIYGQFKSSGLWMGTEDYDEIALLCFAPQAPVEVLTTVQQHRSRIQALLPAPEKQISFSLACGTAVLELLRNDANAALLSQAQFLFSIKTVITAQQAAAAAAAS